MKTYSKNILFLLLPLLFIASSCESNDTIEMIEIPLGEYQQVFSKEGGSFSVEIKYQKEIRFIDLGEEQENTDYVHLSAQKDTIKSDWYQAVITSDQLIQVEVYPNETKMPRNGLIHIKGTQENAWASVSFQQSDR